MEQDADSRRTVARNRLYTNSLYPHVGLLIEWTLQCCVSCSRLIEVKCDDLWRRDHHKVDYSQMASRTRRVRLPCNFPCCRVLQPIVSHFWGQSTTATTDFRLTICASGAELCQSHGAIPHLWVLGSFRVVAAHTSLESDTIGQSHSRGNETRTSKLSDI